ncbi:hypothetical protein HMPREF0880_01324 [Yokenella regensburgei ATCC 43003]|nr:hypothetical protein HMPREF0880_01324 [Yokenella regensburgei ATCC 43003]
MGSRPRVISCSLTVKFDAAIIQSQMNFLLQRQFPFDLQLTLSPS